jgi:aspartokinase-like uncharacterized kinase
MKFSTDEQGSHHGERNHEQELQSGPGGWAVALFVATVTFAMLVWRKPQHWLAWIGMSAHGCRPVS